MKSYRFKYNIQKTLDKIPNYFVVMEIIDVNTTETSVYPDVKRYLSEDKADTRGKKIKIKLSEFADKQKLDGNEVTIKSLRLKLNDL